MPDHPVEPSPARQNDGRWLTLTPLWIWLLLAGVLGTIVGLGSYTFVYAEGFSYFSDNPETCLNCHVMREVFDGWNHSSHKAAAVCNDCHTPHTYPGKYLVKGINGWNHSLAFTTGDFPEPIRINEMNRQVAEENCRYCHETMVVAITHDDTDSPIACLRCHVGVGHGGP
jgi:cytochrome c nitrite reductase small subunit